MRSQLAVFTTADHEEKIKLSIDSETMEEIVRSLATEIHKRSSLDRVITSGCIRNLNRLIDVIGIIKSEDITMTRSAANWYLGDFIAVEACITE